MLNSHLKYWPKRVSASLTPPKTSLYDNLLVSSRRFPDHTAISYYGRDLSYEKLLQEVDSLAGYLQQKLGVASGDKILLFMQNSPQFVITYYAINRANAIVVPINPMLTSEELSFYVKDCEIEHAIVGQELYEKVSPLLDSTSLSNIIIAAYSDYVNPSHDEQLPDEVKAEKNMISGDNHFIWCEVLEENLKPTSPLSEFNDLAVFPYTSGTTGLPKGCMHTNSTVQANTLGAYYWGNLTPNSFSLATLPFFHVTGMVHSMHAPLYAGGTIVILTRWDRNVAAKMIEKYRCSHWITISTMLIDFLSNPNLSQFNIESLFFISGSH